MKTWGFIIAVSLCMIGAILLNTSSRLHDAGTLVFVDYDDSNKNIRSETPYIPDSNGYSVFSVCHTRDQNNSLCKQVKGIIHGVQKWYDDGIITHEDSYDYGDLVQATTYNKNGSKQKECFFKNNQLSQKNYYSEENGNPLRETILYRKNEKIKRYFFNKRVQKEERYRDGKLISRKIYDSDGLLQRLEEYDFDGESLESFDYLIEGFDILNPHPFNTDKHNPNRIIPHNKPSGNWV